MQDSTTLTAAATRIATGTLVLASLVVDSRASTLEVTTSLLVADSDAAPLTNVLDLAVSPDGRVFALDGQSLRVLVFDPYGRFEFAFSQYGEGPGDLDFPSALAFDDSGNVCIADARNLTFFTGMGEFVAATPHGIVDAEVASLRIEPTHGIYLTAFSPFQSTVIHHYTPEGTLVRRFGRSFAAEQGMDTNFEAYLAGGALTLAPNGNLYYSQKTPFKIEAYTLAGELARTVAAERDKFELRMPERKADGRVVYRAYERSIFVAYLEGDLLLNISQFPSDSEDGRLGTALFDLMDLDGHFVASAGCGRFFRRVSKNPAGGLVGLAVDQEAGAEIVSIGLVLKTNGRLVRLEAQ